MKITLNKKQTETFPETLLRLLQRVRSFFHSTRFWPTLYYKEKKNKKEETKPEIKFQLAK